MEYKVISDEELFKYMPLEEMEFNSGKPIIRRTLKNQLEIYERSKILLKSSQEFLQNYKGTDEEEKLIREYLSFL